MEERRVQRPARPSKSLDPTVQLAKGRSKASSERTLLSWMRTSISLITFGFALGKLEEVVPGEPADSALGRAFQLRLAALAFIVIGLVALVGAVYQHRKQIQRLERDDFEFIPNQAITTTLTVCLVIIGFAFFTTLLFDFIL